MTRILATNTSFLSNTSRLGALILTPRKLAPPRQVHQRKSFAPSSPVREFFGEGYWLVCDGSLRPPACREGGSETCCRVEGHACCRIGGLWSETRWLACDMLSSGPALHGQGSRGLDSSCHFNLRMRKRRLLTIICV